MKELKSTHFFLITSLLLFTASCNSPKPRSTDKKPNILFIMADDHAYQAISSYDGSLNQTPNIDRLAKDGMRFTNSFCTNSICGPSRAVMLTGKYSHINGHIDNNVTFDGSQQTFPKLLHEAGYQTAMIGKWHLKSDPTGFDYWNILPGQGQYYNPDFIENGERKRILGYVTDITTDIALNWFDKRDKEKPFCMLLHHKAPHRNWMPAPEYLNKYDSVDFPVPETYFDDYATRGEAERDQLMEIANDMYNSYDLKLPPINKEDSDYLEATFNRMNDKQKADWEKAYKSKNEDFINAHLTGKELAVWRYQRYMQDYLACIASVDDNIGRVLDYLDKEGLSENTIVVYTSDQGFYLGEHGWFDKRFIYEQSLRMPLIVRYPKEIKPSVNDKDMVLNLDFASTFLDFAGIPIPNDMQGRSLRKVLDSDTPDDWRDAIYYRYYEYPGPHSVKRHYGIRTQRYKLVHFYFDVDYWELFDLKNDPLEVNNLYNQPEYSSLIDSLKIKLDDLQKEYNDTTGDQFLPMPDVEVENLAKNCTVKLAFPYHKKYQGGGENGLTNGICTNEKGLGNSGYSAWQGFEGDNLDAIIDLGKITKASSISCGFLQDINSWIFLPRKVTFYISEDGKNFTLISEIKNEKEDNKLSVTREIFKADMQGQPARYIKVVAENIGVCPEWHPGKGNKAWLFADEIIVK
ncbi:MAG: sulfatase-like hydrolase/transferase [Bacteroidales bacterium]|nr:sulfatase-like hydrolase/transferase [Bacteroidales bacterium]MCF8458582.1 sulfatase-like hydrolase/transferase [Bacteroidales bacterium]